MQLTECRISRGLDKLAMAREKFDPGYKP